MSANLISNKTLSNSVIPLKSNIEVVAVIKSSQDFVVPNWYHSLTGILVSGGGGGSATASSAAYAWGGGGGGGGAIIVTPIAAVAGDTLTIVIGAGGAGGTTSYILGSNGGSSSISINSRAYWTITGGSGAQGYQGGSFTSQPTNNGSGGGGRAKPPNFLFEQTDPGGISRGSGTLGTSFWLPVSSFLTNYSKASNDFALSAGNNGLGSAAGQGRNNSIDGGYGALLGSGGGGGGAGILNPGTAAVWFLDENDVLTTFDCGDGGPAALFTINTTNNQTLIYALGGGGGGGSNFGPMYNNTIHPGMSAFTDFPGGSGGNVAYNGTTYYSGGSGGSRGLSAAGGVATYATSGQHGFINTGGGGGGSATVISSSSPTLSGGNGGSGVFILLGRRSYPFSGKLLQ